MAVSALPSTYRGASVIPLAPNKAGDRAHSWDWTAERTSVASGLTTVTTNATYGAETITLNYDGLSRADARILEAFAEARAGAYDGFWCPSFQRDFSVVAADGGGATVREYGYATSVYTLGDWARQFAFYRPGVGWLLSSVYGFSTPGTDGAGNATLPYAVGITPGGYAGTTDAILSANGLAMMRLLYVRFADDAITTNWTHPNFASITLRVVTLPRESPPA